MRTLNGLRVGLYLGSRRSDAKVLPTKTEPLLAASQGVVLIAFVMLGIAALRRFRAA